MNSFRGLFVGIDRYRSREIPWLGCAERDATALHSLFLDSFGGASTLLLGSSATSAEIKAQLVALADCSPDDFVVMGFSGHGSETHELIAYDTDPDRLSETALHLDELTEYFARIPAARLICFLDCCFSGGMGAKVLSIGLRPRSSEGTDALLQKISGHGRLIVTASRVNEEAWEDPRLGHGLLSAHLLEALQGADEIRSGGSASVLRLLEFVAERVTFASVALGKPQSPTLRGVLDIEFAWPKLVPGVSYLRAFPERGRPQASSAVQSLVAFGVPQNILDAWAEAVPSLNALQVDAVNEFRVLDGANLVVSAPTSSGKTLVGELAALKGTAERRRALFLLPTRALVNDKYQEFRRKYDGFGLRTIRATGEFDDEVSDLLRGQYDVALLTYEKCSGILLGSPHVLRQVGTVVIDEAQMITDPSRGANLEFLLTLLRSRRAEGISPQLIALSAVIGDSRGLDEWLDARLLRRNERPVPLDEGVLRADGQFRFVSAEGDERLEPSIRPLYAEGKHRDWLIPLVARLVGSGEQVIVFRETRDETFFCAEYLAESLGLVPASELLSTLPSSDLSRTSRNLRKVLAGGVAFHNTDLQRDERVAIEDHFRRQDTSLRVIVATTTLAMGVNTPASSVVVVGLTHPGPNPVPYTVAEYKNMVGRAGRLGFSQRGRSYVIARNTAEEHEAWQRYIRGTPEDVVSRLLDKTTDPRSLILRVIAAQPPNAPHMSLDQLVEFLDSSLAALQQRKMSNKWTWSADQLKRDVRELEAHQLVTLRDDSGYELTALGRIAGESGIAVESVIRLVAALRSTQPEQLTDSTLVTAAQLSTELDDVYFPMNKRSVKKELPFWPQVLAQQGVARGVLVALSRGVTEAHVPSLRAKKAYACLVWMSNWPRARMEEFLTQFGGGFAATGALQSISSRTGDLLPTVARIAELLHPGLNLSGRLDALLCGLSLSLPVQLSDLAKALGRDVPRATYLALQRSGITSHEAIASLTDDDLMRCVGNREQVILIRRLLDAAAQKARTEPGIDPLPPVDGRSD